MGIVRLRNLNLLFKLGISVGIIIFALMFRSIFYNFVVILVMIGLIHFQRVRIFRFRSLSYGFVFFLFVIFIFRSLTGYGKIYAGLPFGLQLTSGGFQQAILTIEQFLLIFLLMGLSLYTSSREEVFFYFHKISGGGKKNKNVLIRMGRISFFVLYLLPELFTRGRSFREKLQSQNQEKWRLRNRFFRTLRLMEDFVVEVLYRAERLYPDFVDQTNRGTHRPVPVKNLRHYILFVVLVSFHFILLWMG